MSGPSTAASARIKVCGLTRAEDARLALELGAWGLGFIHYPRSPRAVGAEQVREILRATGANGRRSASGDAVRTTGVFVNADLPAIAAFVRESGVNTVQLHGDEPPDYCRAVLQMLPGVTLLKALRLRNEEELESLSGFAGVCEALVLDTYQQGTYGGTGMVGNWELARKAKSFHRTILSGGLTPENLQAAQEAVNPWALDVSSGIEIAPGAKSPERMRKLFEERS